MDNCAILAPVNVSGSVEVSGNMRHQCETSINNNLSVDKNVFQSRRGACH